jgi:non-specific protein-tyrosine kinase
MVRQLNDNLQSLDAQIKIYRQQIAGLESQPPSTERDNTLLQMRGQLITLQSNEATTLLALAQTANQANAPGTATLIEQALPGTPVSGELARNLALALLVSLLVGVGIVLLVNYLGDGIDSPGRLREVVGTAPLAAIGIVEESGPKSGSSNNRKNQAAQTGTEIPDALVGKRLVTLERPHSLEAESFRVLRDNIRFTSPDKPLRSVVVASASRGEGKSFIAANLAVVMAQSGERVILVDADLRNPSLHNLFGLSNQTGFTNLILNGSSDLEQAVQSVPVVENLVVVTSGSLPANPPDLLGSHLAAQLVQDLAQVADIVLYDTPPAEDVMDAVILGAQTGDVLLVVRAGSARRDTVAHVKQSLLRGGVTRVLTVLNGVRARNMQNYSYKYYSNRNVTAVATETSTNGKAPVVVSPTRPRPAEEVSTVLESAGQ